MKKLLTYILLLLPSTPLMAQTLRVAVAANTQFVMKSLQEDFMTKTGIKIQVIVGSSGKLSTQIKNGAPYDMFLSADMEFPNQLYKEGFGLIKPKLYAKGSLIVASTSELAVKNWRMLLTQTKVNKIAIANPALAPYGKAAEQALRRYGLWGKIHSKIVYGESISQVNTYLSTASVDIAFTTEAFVYENLKLSKLKWERIDPKAYTEIQQGMLLLAYAKKGSYKQAVRFYEYLQTPAARQIFRKYGYGI